MNAILHNYKQIRNIIDSRVKVMAVVKSDAYGHGALKVSQVLVENGADYLAVATNEEGLELREQFKDIPILILGYTPQDKISEAISNNITLTIYNINIARVVSECAKELGREAKVHIKIDTGMNRIGFRSNELNDLFEIITFSNMKFEGIYTHFTGIDFEDTHRQFTQFMDVCSKLEGKIDFVYRHCCNSGAIMKYPEMHLDMIRPGIALYGLNPEPNYLVEYNKLLKPAMSLKSEIIHLKYIPKGEKISYGGTYTTMRDSLVATVPVGYGDGYPRKLSNEGRVLVNGKFAPIVGRICMDQSMIDVTDLKVDLFDEVILFGSQGENIIKVDEIANKLDTINYEIVCSMTKRLPRVYLSST